MAERIHQIEIDLSNAADEITVDEWLNISEGQQRAVVDVMARFVVKDGKRIPYDQARGVLGNLSLRQFGEFVEMFRGAVQNSAVPPANGRESEPV